MISRNEIPSLDVWRPSRAMRARYEPPYCGGGGSIPTAPAGTEPVRSDAGAAAVGSSTKPPPRVTRSAPKGPPHGGWVDPARRAAFERAGYDCVKDTVKKVALFSACTSRREVYLVNGDQDIVVAVHPELLAYAKAVVRDPGSCVKDGFFHHANLLTFPLRENGGQKPVHYGRAVICRTLGALEEFLRAFGAT